MKTIIFYAPLGNGIPIEKIGGAEVGCLKTKSIYEKAGIRVITLDKPVLYKGKLRYFLELSLLPFKLLLLLLRYPRSPLHLVGFYRTIAIYEWILMEISKKSGHRVIYELRNGSMVYSYHQGNKIYRKILKDLLLKPDIVLCQGEDYVHFIKQQWGMERCYYPNYTKSCSIDEISWERPLPIKLIYFGRVVKSKNVDMIIEVLFILRKSGLNAVLDIIGGYSFEYKELLDNIILQKKLIGYVKFHGRRSFDYIEKHLKQSHYFIFPSQEEQEGHSNSLTEAMGCGVVPIVSNVGFNASICANAYLVLDLVKSDCFAQKIIEIENNKYWKQLSQEVYQRVQENYTEEVVSKKLLAYIAPLFN